jgi:hypothetical protein
MHRFGDHDNARGDRLRRLRQAAALTQVVSLAARSIGFIWAAAHKVASLRFLCGNRTARQSH